MLRMILRGGSSVRAPARGGFRRRGGISKAYDARSSGKHLVQVAVRLHEVSIRGRFQCFSYDRRIV